MHKSEENVLLYRATYTAKQSQSEKSRKERSTAVTYSWYRHHNSSRKAAQFILHNRLRKLPKLSRKVLVLSKLARRFMLRKWHKVLSTGVYAYVRTSESVNEKVSNAPVVLLLNLFCRRTIQRRNCALVRRYQNHPAIPTNGFIHG